MLRPDVRVFLVVSTAAYILLAFIEGSFLRALGALPMAFLVSIVLGAVGLWFVERIYFLLRNIVRTEDPKRQFQRTIWQHMTLALAIGMPIWFFLERFRASLHSLPCR